MSELVGNFGLFGNFIMIFSSQATLPFKGFIGIQVNNNIFQLVALGVQKLQLCQNTSNILNPIGKMKKF
ncbi:MAG: hypothetical protein IPH28_09340 [Cytophagaceae bacterium]|nr:hypothetical protein [Cytophagaceae bacterium]MBL0325965.1 hypothetical protein [Cytophagaceae bacterium]